ncbi:c-type cytochrome [Sneathiella chungangensis]|uniref:C-type cytochrome n=1 Tax=Sneathiella chungangensis TaxID=1418234 RepID=A0A845MDT3_9PROT|nr:cytochrome c [Sneathiella chungangensis]MZR22039.1 c-type cytochrome [Sneathiella chungangensis]
MNNAVKNLAFVALILAVIVSSYFIIHESEEKDSLKGAPIAEVMVPTLTEPGEMGQQVFDRYCVTCHGINAAGRDGIGPPLVHIYYEPGHHSDESFTLAVKNGVKAHHWPFGDMPPVTDVSDADIANLITYIRELQKANGIF